VLLVSLGQEKRGADRLEAGAAGGYGRDEVGDLVPDLGHSRLDGALLVPERADPFA